MKAYKCDRCGKLYELTNKERVIRSTCVYGVHDSFGNFLDLCGKCFDELQEWAIVYKEVESEGES